MPAGGHYLFRNLLPPAVARRSLAVDVVDDRGRHTKAGAEVRVYAAGTRRLISSGLVDTGGGYCSQNVMPVHVGHRRRRARRHRGDLDDEIRTPNHGAAEPIRYAGPTAETIRDESGMPIRIAVP